ncbi:MAG: hypothetical protein JO266_20655 [Acidobacteria bacterium]|nr:hypothetical protein [Acidobacteriota bacterium]
MPGNHFDMDLVGVSPGFFGSDFDLVHVASAGVDVAVNIFNCNQLVGSQFALPMKLPSTILGPCGGPTMRSTLASSI